MAFLVCLLFRESIGVAITKSFVIFVRKFFVSSISDIPYIYQTSDIYVRHPIYKSEGLKKECHMSMAF